MSDARKLECQCGCGEEAYYSQLDIVTVEHADDRSRRSTGKTKNYWVRKECRTAFEEELGLQKVLTDLVLAWRPGRPSGLRFWRWPIVFRDWIRRIGVARRVMQLTHEIYERPRGFEYARVHAQNAAVMFAAPRWAQGFLVRWVSKRLKREVDALIEKRAAAADVEEVSEATRAS